MSNKLVSIAYGALIAIGILLFAANAEARYINHSPDVKLMPVVYPYGYSMRDYYNRFPNYNLYSPYGYYGHGYPMYPLWGKNGYYHPNYYYTHKTPAPDYEELRLREKPVPYRYRSEYDSDTYRYYDPFRKRYLRGEKYYDDPQRIPNGY